MSPFRENDIFDDVIITTAHYRAIFKFRKQILLLSKTHLRSGVTLQRPGRRSGDRLAA